MLGRRFRQIAMLVVATLAVAPLAVSSAPLRAEGFDQRAYDAAIGDAKSAMMADSASALSNARKAAGLVSGDGDEAQNALLTARWLEAEALMRLNRADEASGIIAEAIRKAAEQFNGSKLHADLLRSQANLEISQGEYGDALSSFLAAHELYEQLGEDRSRAIVLQNIGSLYSDARDYERVLNYYEQAKEAYPQDKVLALSAHNNLGNAFKELERFDEAEAEFRAALDVARQMDSPLLEARILTNIASTQLLAGALSDADHSVDLGLAIAYSNAPEWRPFLYGVRAQIAVAKGNFGAAQRFLDATFENEDLSTTSPFFRDFHDTAYTVYSQDGNYELAAKHLEAFYRIDSQARDISSTANNALLAARFDAANRDLEIAKLSLEKTANEAKLNTFQGQVIFLTLLVLVIILAFIGALFALRAVNRNRSAIEAANAKLTHVIQHDSLTKLFARDHFRNQLETAIAQRAASARPPILAFIDLDRFKQVNDVFGHATGDKLLSKVADRFRAVAGEETIIGRLGGDEFAMIMPPDMETGDAADLAKRIIDEIAEPFIIDGNDILIGASIGITIADEIANVSVHMTNADLALYEAKDLGRGTYVVYEPDMRAKLDDRSSLENDLEDALENGQLSVFYQPIVKGVDKAVLAYEALLRWSHPTRGTVPPSVFIPVAEESRLIERLGEWALRKSCEEANKWPAGTTLNVNISPVQMADPAFLNIVTHALASSGLSPDRLTLELTESLVIQMEPQLEQLLKSLRSLGVSFALDDFGKGYSSLNYIDQMNFSMIKIDREFVQSAAEGSSRSHAVVTAIVALAQSLDIDVTAEGIEDEEQAKTMEQLGCNCFQGYHFGKPSSSVADLDERDQAAA